MTFDPQLVEAKLVLDMLPPEELPGVAAEALEAGLDGRFIRRMAALDRPSGWEVDQILPKFRAEAGLTEIQRGEAALRVARDLAQRILRENLDPLAFTGEFHTLWVHADYAREIQIVGTLDDDKYLAQYFYRTEEQFRDLARQKLIDLVKTDC
ncbi:MAG TPA: hypothetical protein VIY53_11665 [Acidobacteriaceae bacterium]